MNILIVDDDLILGRSIARLLAHLGHQSRSVASVEAALRELAREPPDVLLTDFDLGASCNGVDLVGWARNGYRIPAVMLTGHDPAEVRDELAAAGLGDVRVLAKPFELEGLEVALAANDNGRPVAWAAETAPARAESAPPRCARSSAARPPATRIARRTALAALGALGTFTWLACDGGGGDVDAGGTAGTGGGDGAASCTEIPDETAGPFPDSLGMVGKPAYYRSDVTEGKPGIPLTLTLTVVDAGNGCAPIAGAHVEIWHCDAAGVYSEYASGMNPGTAASTYLRGLQTTDAAGRVTFQTIYPGWYSGRVTHIHIQIYDGTTLRKTTQLGFPDATNAAVYASAFYTKGQSPTDNDSDQVFGDGADGGGHELQIAAVTGDNDGGYVATLPLAIKNFR